MEKNSSIETSNNSFLESNQRSRINNRNESSRSRSRSNPRQKSNERNDNSNSNNNNNVNEIDNKRSHTPTKKFTISVFNYFLDGFPEDHVLEEETTLEEFKQHFAKHNLAGLTLKDIKQFKDHRSQKLPSTYPLYRSVRLHLDIHFNKDLVLSKKSQDTCFSETFDGMVDSVASMERLHTRKGFVLVKIIVGVDSEGRIEGVLVDDQEEKNLFVRETLTTNFLLSRMSVAYYRVINNNNSNDNSMHLNEEQQQQLNSNNLKIVIIKAKLQINKVQPRVSPTTTETREKRRRTRFRNRAREQSQLLNEQLQGGGGDTESMIQDKEDMECLFKNINDLQHRSSLSPSQSQIPSGNNDEDEEENEDAYFDDEQEEEEIGEADDENCQKVKEVWGLPPSISLLKQKDKLN